MKKGLLLILLLATFVCAQQEPVPIPRYSDFPLDNIHILRIQEASQSIASNVSKLEARIAGFEQAQTQELNAMRTAIDEFKRTQATQLVAVEEGLAQISRRIERAPSIEAPIKFPPVLVTLLSVNVLMLFIVIILIIYLRNRYAEYLNAKKEFAQHIHPAPEELVDYVQKQLKKKKLHDIRLDLADKGWSPSIIEHAIHAAKER